MSFSFVKKTNVLVKNLFNFVATLQEESCSEGIYNSFYLFRLSYKIHRHAGWSKISLVFKNFPTRPLVEPFMKFENNWTLEF
jgi:hypothetical protein